MLKIVFKNLEPSQLVRDVVTGRVRPVIEKFPELQNHRITLTLEMQNSPRQAGPDLFTVRTIITGNIYRNLKLEKSSENFFLATAAMTEGLNELLGQETNRLASIRRRGRAIHPP